MTTNPKPNKAFKVSGAGVGGLGPRPSSLGPPSEWEEGSLLTCQRVGAVGWRECHWERWGRGRGYGLRRCQP